MSLFSCCLDELIRSAAREDDGKVAWEDFRGITPCNLCLWSTICLYCAPCCILDGCLTSTINEYVVRIDRQKNEVEFVHTAKNGYGCCDLCECGPPFGAFGGMRAPVWVYAEKGRPPCLVIRTQRAHPPERRLRGKSVDDYRALETVYDGVHALLAQVNSREATPPLQHPTHPHPLRYFQQGANDPLTPCAVCGAFQNDPAKCDPLPLGRYRCTRVEASRGVGISPSCPSYSLCVDCAKLQGRVVVSTPGPAVSPVEVQLTPVPVPPAAAAIESTSSSYVTSEIS